MPTFKLPRGYAFEPPADAVASILVDDRGLYGGADISDHYDAGGNHFVLCCATGPGDPAFRLRGFRRAADSVKYVEVPLAIEPAGMVITGRGNSDIQWIDGVLHFSGWRDKAFFLGTIPSFVPFPSIPSLDARIAALEAESVAALREYVAGIEARLAATAAHLADVEAVMHETQNETARVKAYAEGIAGGGLTDLEELRIVRA